MSHPCRRIRTCEFASLSAFIQSVTSKISAASEVGRGRAAKSRKVIISRLTAAGLAAALLLAFWTAAPRARASSGGEASFSGSSSQIAANYSAMSQDGPTTRPRRSTDAQDDKPIKLSTDLVTVLTSVYDSSGNHVNNLTAGDFQIFEDNKPQDIQGLYREDQLPLKLVFLFDTSLSIKHRFDFEQRAAAQFFRQVMRPGDQAAIISVSTDPRIEIQYTSDVDKLVYTLSRLQPGGSTSLYSAMIVAAKYLRPAEGRHVMVVLSDGDDTSSAATLAQALAEIQKSDAMVYAVHSTGVAPSVNVQDLGGEFVLKAMAEDTGGRSFFPPIYKEQEKEVRDLDDIYRRIAAEVRAQYVLTYYSRAESRDGRFRSIRVELKRAGLQVRARRGYYSDKTQ